MAGPSPAMTVGMAWTRTACSVPQIRTTDRLVSTDLGRRPGDHDAARLQQIRVLGNLQRKAGILLDEQDRHALILTDAMHDIEDLLNDQRCQAERWLVQQQQL